MIRDSDNKIVREGDTIQFSYGIPPVKVLAPVKKIRGVLWAMTPEHNPKKCKAEDLRRHVGDFYVVTDPAKLHRTDSPGTSVAAARKVNTRQMEHRVLMAVVDAGDAGVTAKELLAMPRFQGVPYSSITSRPSALENKGLIFYKKNEPSRDGARIMRATRAGQIEIQQKQDAFDNAISSSNAMPGLPESF